MSSMIRSRRIRFRGLLVVFFSLLTVPFARAADFHSYWPESINRAWIGPEYWSNPLQDWRVAGGRLECVVSGGDRNVFLLTRELGARRGDFEMSVVLGQLADEERELTEGWVGFKIGLRGHFDDYRDTAVRGEGLNVGMTTDGRLFIGKSRPNATRIPLPFQNIELRLRARPVGRAYRLRLEAYDDSGTRLSEISRSDLEPDWLVGGIALACGAGEVRPTPAFSKKVTLRTWKAAPDERRQGNVRFWFSDWKVSGSKAESHEERAYGPILFGHYTLSRSILKLTAQIAPVGNASRQVQLQIRDEAAEGWRTIAQSGIDELARTAVFRIPNWEVTRDIPYRLAYTLQASDQEAEEYYFRGTIRKDPVDKETIVVAAFTGNHDFGFPHREVAEHVRYFDPDVLVFTGDQIYEPVGGYGIQREPVEVAALDYLRKWYIYGWAFRELFRDRPTVCLIDDHDVYHGNIWGAGGRATKPCGAEGQDQGGYCMDAEWVKAVHRIQTSHLPDPYDPTPVEQDIPVYYTDMMCGGVSFAILEDRKWKSAPRVMLPEADIRNGWARNPDYDAALHGDVPGSVLLGERQLGFLEKWAADWGNGTWAKVVVSQTIFANVATMPKDAESDAVYQGLPILDPGEYAANDKLAQDHDSNGWPQSGRNRALRAMRRGFAIHIAGDQHLGSTIQYGVEDWNDAAFALCVPSVSNIFPRRWFPPEPGMNGLAAAPEYTGRYRDGFGNRMTVHAVSNPHAYGVEPTALNDRAPGFGIVTLNRSTRTITFANWPRWVEVSQPGSEPYPGWPVVIDQLENYGRAAKRHLPMLEVRGMGNPVVQVIREPDDEIVYTIRIRGNRFRPKVFDGGPYTLKVGEPGTPDLKVLTGIEAVEGEGERLILEF